MHGTWLEHPETPRTEAPAVSVYPGGGGLPRVVGMTETRPDWAGGGLVSTADDLPRLARGLHDGSLLEPSA